MASRTLPIPAGRLAGPACLAGLALAVASLFPGVLKGGVFFVQDVMVQNVPWRHFLHEALADGRLPLWEPAVNCGFPLFAEGQVGALYPPNWLLALLPPAAAVTWSVLGHLWLAAAATWAFLRALGCGRLPALTGGLTYGLGGYLVVRAMSPNFVAAAALLPVLFWLLETGLARGRPLRIVLAGGVAGLQLLAGHPQAALYGLAAAAAYAVLRAWQLGRRQLAGAALLAAPGAAIAAVQLLPTWELAAESGRAGGLGYEQFVNMSLPPERLICLLLPDFFGNSAAGSYWGREAGFFIQLCPYIGAAGLVLALIAVREGESPVRGFFALLAVLGLALSLGHYSGLFHALHEVPVLRQLRIPTRFLLWWAFAGAVLAGLGVQRLAVDRRPLRTSWVRVCALLALAAGLAALVNGPALRGDAALPPGQERLLERYGADLAGDLLRLAPVLLALGLLTAAPVRRRMGPGALAGAAALVCLAELNDFGRPFNGVLPPEAYERVPPAARAVQADAERWRSGAAPGVPLPGLVRVASLVSERNSPYDWHGGWAHDLSSYERYPGTLRMYTAGLFGLANTLPGWSPLHPRRHWELTRAYPTRLDMTNAGYVISHGALTTPTLELVHTGRERVYRHLEALPRAWVAPAAVVEPDPRRRLARLRAPGFDPRRQVLLDRPPEAAPGAGGGYAPARIARYEATAVDVELPGRGGFLVLADSFAPGWEARVDGQRREVLKANHAFRAVPVTAGDRLVSFRYRPSSLSAGAGLSAAALLLWLLALWRARSWSWPESSQVAGAVPSVHVAVQVAAIVILYGIARETALWSQTVERMRLLAVLGG